jgi:hypothetical protein
MDVISKLEMEGCRQKVMTLSLLAMVARGEEKKKDRSQSDWGGPS